jgi:hypothetical protein
MLLPLPKPGKQIGKPRENEFAKTIGNFKKVRGTGSCFAFCNSYPDGTPDFEVRETFVMKFNCGSYQREPYPPSGVVASHLSVGRPSRMSCPALLHLRVMPRRSASDTQSLQGYFGE